MNRRSTRGRLVLRTGFTYDERTHSIRFQGAAKKKAFTAKIDVTYEEQGAVRRG